ncbi:hypothetical protein Tco_1358991, partial [Tanacetum coccineum]
DVSQRIPYFLIITIKYDLLNFTGCVFHLVDPWREDRMKPSRSAKRLMPITSDIGFSEFVDALLQEFVDRVLDRVVLKMLDSIDFMRELQCNHYSFSYANTYQYL